MTKDLESDSYAHVTSGIQVVTAAATAFILQNVTNPPPQLFLRDPNAYRAQVNSAGGLVLLYWLRYTGFVASVWQAWNGSGDASRKSIISRASVWRLSRREKIVRVLARSAGALRRLA